ncbi:triacylglycerol lipase [Streptomyces ficellus]|uniref:Triacylglycerol lipase n=1 Tax=Streptomyces ficellus TaxID=1977088 RepID=A0ABT7ZAH2_9ACTN|nr:triacylglycerol lipase [Streptomyces ficellus]MDN3296504.1 triacylglycerol lipase [Streptomyces ficellus]
MRSHLIVPAVAAAALLLALPAMAPAAAADTSTYRPSSNPILFVHGYNGSASNWDTMVSRFKNDGWPASHLDQWSYDSRQSNATTAEQLAGEVDRLLAATGAAKVDVVTHSMGGLSSRHYAKNLGGDAKTEAWVSLGGPNHGTDTANSCFDTSCYEMRVGSDFLTALNSGDETPGSPRYATWWSPCDTVINPDSSVALSGARNTQTACLSHNGLLTDATVYAQARDMINS